MKKMDVQSIIDSVKEMIEEGNVARIVVKKGKKELLNIPASVELTQSVDVGALFQTK